MIGVLVSSELRAFLCGLPCFFSGRLATWLAAGTFFPNRVMDASLAIRWDLMRRYLRKSFKGNNFRYPDKSQYVIYNLIK